MEAKTENKWSKLAVFTVNGDRFLGKRSGNVIKGMQLMSDHLTENRFAEYLMAKNVDELRTREIGANSDVDVDKLTRREKLWLRTVKAEYKEARRMADDHLVNQVFQEFRGKKQ